jgi:hypothetical protein
MSRGGIGRTIFAAVLFFIIITIFTAPTQGLDNPQPELTIEMDFDKPRYNLSRPEESITFHGWVNWTGVSVIPITIHLYGSSDIGEVYLTPSTFTFQLPDSIPFDGLIPIPPENITTATPALTIGGYYDKGGIRTNIAPRSCIIPVYYWEENQTLDVEEEPNEENHILPLIVGSYLVITTVFVAVISRKTVKSQKRRT